MKTEKTNQLQIINWFGIITGLLMLAIPFLGPWWKATVGTEAIKLALSPFHYHFTIIEEPLKTLLITYIILAAKLTFLIGGTLLIIGSIKSNKWWGKKFVKFGSLKPLAFVITFIGVLLIVSLLINRFLPNLLPKIAGTEAIQIKTPYLVGTTYANIQAQNIQINAPITFTILPKIWIAIITAILGITTRIYQRKLKKKHPSKNQEKTKQN